MTNQAKNPNYKLTLLIDTSKREARVALIRDGAVFDSREWPFDFAQGKDRVGELLRNIDGVLKDNNLSLDDIKRIAVHAGPGHFSALRSGIVTATMLAEAKNVELVSLKGNDMAALVNEAIENNPVDIVEPLYS